MVHHCRVLSAEGRWCICSFGSLTSRVTIALTHRQSRCQDRLDILRATIQTCSCDTTPRRCNRRRSAFEVRFGCYQEDRQTRQRSISHLHLRIDRRTERYGPGTQSVLIIFRVCSLFVFKATRESLDFCNAQHHQPWLVRLGGEQHCTGRRHSTNRRTSLERHQRRLEVLGCVQPAEYFRDHY